MASTSNAALALIPLRGGSRGLPGKNMMMFAGKPLYRHAVDQAIRTAGRCLISTDIEAILDADLPDGCEVLRRPEDLATSDVPMAPVISHALTSASMREGRIVLLQATSPLRLDSDIMQAMALHDARGFTLTMSVTPADAGVQKWGRILEDRFETLAEPDLCFANRQALPPVYRPNGAVYVFDAADYLEAGTFPAARIGAYTMPPERSLDIDTEDDFRAAEAVMLARAE